MPGRFGVRRWSFRPSRHGGGNFLFPFVSFLCYIRNNTNRAGEKVLPEQRQQSQDDERGSILLDALLAIGIVMAVLAFAWRDDAKKASRIRNLVVSEQFRIMHEAVGGYVAANDAAVRAAIAANGGVPVPISVAALQGAGFLGPFFQAVNGYSQGWRAFARETTGGLLEVAVVSEGGRVIPDRWVPRIAAGMGADGGYVDPDTPNTARGAFGGWQLDLTPYLAAGYVPQAGHLVSIRGFSGSQNIGDYLLRFAVPGHPEANRMATALDMDGNDIVNAGSVSATTVTASTNLSGDTASVTGELSAGTVTVAGNLTADTISATTSLDAPSINPGGTEAVFGGDIRAGDVFLTARNNWLGELLPRYSMKGGYYVGDGGTVPKPACNGGDPKIILTPAQQLLPAAVVGAQVTYQTWAVDAGGDWTIYAKAFDSGVQTSAGTVIARTYCYYA